MTREEALEKLTEIFSEIEENKNEYELRAKNDEFILQIKIDNDEIICCLKELSWKQYMAIEAFSYREDSDGNYFSGEYEKREILKKVLVWILEPHSGRVEYNDSYGRLLSKIKYEIVDKIYTEYFRYINLDAKEANYIYNSALKYFNGTAQEDKPVLPLIIEVDFMAKGIMTITRDEFSKIPITEFEKIQLILAARADALNLAPQNEEKNKFTLEQSNIMEEMNKYMSTLPKRRN
jgi:frataxin-like iron-binding protein CyaY